MQDLVEYLCSTLGSYTTHFTVTTVSGRVLTRPLCVMGSLTTGSGANISLHIHPPAPDVIWIGFSIWLSKYEKKYLYIKNG